MMGAFLTIRALTAKLNSTPNQIEPARCGSHDVLVLLVGHIYIDNNISAD